MTEEGTVGTTAQYWPLGQQRRTDNNDETRSLDATISHMKGGWWRSDGGQEKAAR